jgi:hypothetical protein
MGADGTLGLQATEIMMVMAKNLAKEWKTLVLEEIKSNRTLQQSEFAIYGVSDDEQEEIRACWELHCTCCTGTSYIATTSTS